MNIAVEQKGLFTGPWTGNSIADWTVEVRKQQQVTLKDATALETTAIAEVERALAAES